jgi:hypothetical protein
MQQTLHIFRKDVRHLWPRIVAVLLLMMAHAYFETRRLTIYLPGRGNTNGISTTLDMLLPLSIWFLIAWVAFQEALPGDRQFWLTRPYRWPQLLASKVLFVFVFISIPLFISDCYILAAQGFPVVSVLPRLLLRQLIVAALFVLPSFVIATVTTGTSQFVLAGVVLLLSLVCAGVLASNLTGSNVIGFSNFSFFIGLLVVTGCGVIIWQYAKRRTTIARWALLASVCSLPLLWSLPSLAQFGSLGPGQPYFSEQPSVRFAYDLGRSIPAQRSWPSPQPGFVLVRIPLTVAGLPPATVLRGSGRVSIEVGGDVWPRPGSIVVGSIEKVGDDYWQSLEMNASEIGILRQQPVNLRTSFDLEIVADTVERKESLVLHSFFVPSLGRCQVVANDPQMQLTCRVGLEDSVETTVRLDLPHGPRQSIGTFVPDSMPFGLSPTSDLGVVSFPVSSLPSDAEIAFIPRRKIAAFQRSLNLEHVQLSDYFLPR